MKGTLLLKYGPVSESVAYRSVSFLGLVVLASVDSSVCDEQYGLYSVPLVLLSNGLSDEGRHRHRPTSRTLHYIANSGGLGGEFLIFNPLDLLEALDSRDEHD
jgi:hypothetical protein